MIVVSGANGFVGQHLVKYLSAHSGEQVRALYRKSEPNAEMSALPGVTWLQCDLLDVYAVEEAMHGAHAVYHCAAQISHLPKKSSGLLRNNVESTSNLINALLQLKDVKLLHVSSIAALGNAAGTGKEISETDEIGDEENVSVYGKSKYLSEMEVWRGIAEGLDGVIVNPGVILGQQVAAENTTANFLNYLKKGIPFFPTGGTAWVSVADTVKAMVLLMNASKSGERYIISAGNTSFKHILELIATEMKIPSPKRALSKMAAEVAWRTESLLAGIKKTEPMLTKELVRILLETRKYDNSKFLKLFPDFKYEAIEDTVRNLVNSK
jgi:dihydroflavonol-4-reductase